MPSKEAKMYRFCYAFLLLAIVAVVEIEGNSRYLSNRPPANYKNNAAHHLRQHQLAAAEQKQTNSTSTQPETQNFNPINCVKGGAKRFPDSKDESRFHMCTFSTSHRIWMVYSFNCPKLTIFDAKSQKCASKASVLNLPQKRIPWDQRIQQNLHQKYPQNTNSKIRPTAVTLQPKVGNSSKTNNNIISSQTSKPAVTSPLSGTERIPTSSTVGNRIPIRNSVPAQNTKNQHLIRYPNLLQRLTTTAAPPKKNTFNRIRPGNVTPVNRRYTTTPPSRTRTRRPLPTARTTTVKTTTSTTTTTEKAMEASESLTNLSPDLHSSFGSGEGPGPDPDPVDRTKVTGSGSNSNAESSIGVIRTVAGKIAYLAQAIESLLTAFEGSMGYHKPCVDATTDSAGNLNGNSISKIDAHIEGFGASEGGVALSQPEPAPTEAPPSLISPSDLKNILDFFTVGNPVNKEIANKVMGTAAGSQTTSTSNTEQTENDPKGQSPPPQSPVHTEGGSSSEEDETSEENTALRLPPPPKEFDVPSSQSSSPMLTDEDVAAPGPGPADTAASSARPNTESENQIQQSDQNVNEEEGDQPTKTETSGVDDASISSPPKLDADLSDVQPSNEPQVAPSGTRDSSPVSVEHAEILKIGSTGSNRRPR